MTHDMYRNDNGQTFDMARFNELVENRRRSLQNAINGYTTLGNSEEVRRFQSKLLEVSNIVSLVRLCTTETDLRWVVNDKVTDMGKDATAEDMMKYLEANVKDDVWKNACVRFVCNRYDNAEDARDRLWDALVSKDPMLDIVDLTMEDICALRRAGEDAEDGIERFIIQFKEVTL